MRDHFDDADHSQRSLIHDGPHSGSLHAGTGASEKFGIGMAGLEDFDQPGGIQIPGSFAGGDEDAHLRPVYRFCIIETQMRYLLVVVFAIPLYCQKDWPVYSGDAGGQHYSSLTQLNPRHVGKLNARGSTA
jgi:hypothetical protein